MEPEAGRMQNLLAEEAMVRIIRGKTGGVWNRKLRGQPRKTLPALLLINDLSELLDKIAIQLPWDYTVRQSDA